MARLKGLQSSVESEGNRGICGFKFGIWIKIKPSEPLRFGSQAQSVSFLGHTAGLTAGRALSCRESMNTTQETASPPTNYLNAAPGAFKAMVGLESYLKGCGIEANLIELVKLRVSQMNGCAYCIDNHAKKLLSGGELNQRLYLLSAWRDANCYSKREQAAFAWAEAVTRISESEIDGVTSCKGQEAFYRERIGRPDAHRHRHQRLEPVEHQLWDSGRLPILKRPEKGTS